MKLNVGPKGPTPSSLANRQLRLRPVGRNPRVRHLAWRILMQWRCLMQRRYLFTLSCGGCADDFGARYIMPSSLRFPLLP